MKPTAAVCLLSLLFVVNNGFAQDDSTIIGAAGIRFVKIPAGDFVYGKFEPPYPQPESGNQEYKGYRPEDFDLARKYATRDSRPGFRVHVDSFWIGQIEVTQKQWKRVMTRNPSVFRGDELPVDNVSWEAAAEFARKLSETDSRYSYRLPTEFEWEHAARAGAIDDISWDEIREQAQLGTRTTNKGAQKKANRWGLYDMLGNVWEWTSDLYNEKIFADSTPTSSGNQHVLKGASFVGDVKNATYMTHAAGPANGWDVGFRLVMTPRRDSAVVNRKSGNKLKSKDVIPGWHISRTTHQGTTPRVTLSEGIITLEQHPYGQGGVLLTNKKYGDFELSVDVRIDSFCNGGIFLRATESGQAYQVELAEPGGTGSVFGEMLRISKSATADKRSAVWRAGDWNNFRVRMTGRVPRIKLWINDSLMYDVVQPKNDFTAHATEGMIGLQVHWSATYSTAARAFDMSSSWRPGGKHQFRNIRIKELRRSR
jgi:sulfatase modifying factor 1